MFEETITQKALHKRITKLVVSTSLQSMTTKEPSLSNKWFFAQLFKESIFFLKNIWFGFVSISFCARAIDILYIDFLKFCYVPATCATVVAFLLQPLTVLMIQTWQAVCAINQSIFLRCLRLGYMSVYRDIG